MTDEDWKKADAVFPHMLEDKRKCVLSIGFPLTDGLSGVMCQGWKLPDGVKLFKVVVTCSMRPMSEYLWTVSKDADITLLVDFMQRMARRGCMVELGWRDLEMMR